MTKIYFPDDGFLYPNSYLEITEISNGFPYKFTTEAFYIDNNSVIKSYDGSRKGFHTNEELSQYIDYICNQNIGKDKLSLWDNYIFNIHFIQYIEIFYILCYYML